MKKLLALALALTMALTLAACGGKSDSDVKYVKDKGTLVVGMTDFAPMDYRDGNGEWIGFDADMAKAFAESLGVKAEFIEITWDSKAMELETKAIDVVWNGMTLTDEVKSLMGVSEPYCKNAQVVVLSADLADQYMSADAIGSLTFAVENGSAGQEVLDGMGIAYTAAQDQATDRAHRIGQRQVVTVYKLLMKDTLEEKIQKLQEQKARLSDEIISEGSIRDTLATREELFAILEGGSDGLL